MNKWREVAISTKTGNILNSIFIRLVNPTCQNRPGFRIVACHGPGNRYTHDDLRASSIIEEVGYFDKSINSIGKRVCLLDIAKIRKYISEGAEPTIPVWKLLGASGAFPVHPMVYSEAAKNQYLQSVFPQSDQLITIDPPSTYKIGQVDRSVKKVIKKTEKRKHAAYMNTLKTLELEDRENKLQGKIKTGDYLFMLNKMRSLQDCNPQQRQNLEQKFVDSYWNLNHHTKYSKGLHSSFRRSGHEKEAIDMYKKQYYFWTKKVRGLKYTDPFKLWPREEIHREGENEELLKSTKIR